MNSKRLKIPQMEFNSGSAKTVVMYSNCVKIPSSAKVTANANWRTTEICEYGTPWISKKVNRYIKVAPAQQSNNTRLLKESRSSEIKWDDLVKKRILL
jgi:hypothetical protein